MDKAEINISRRIGFMSTTSADILQAGSKIIDSNANKIESLLGRKKISDLINLNVTVNDEKEIINLFSNGVGFDLRFYECLSLAYVCRFNEHHAAPTSSYAICVDVDDRFKNLTDTELFFSDGVLAHLMDGDVEGFMPMQQVLAQNIIGRNLGKDITDILVAEAIKKIKRRESYNDISGLVISVISKESPIDMQKFVDSVDLSTFNPTFLVVYGAHGNLKKALVIHLSSSITNLNELKKRSLRISMPTAPSMFRK